MADGVIKVSVSANKKKSVTVSSNKNNTEITATADAGRFWAQTAKNWAVSDFIVDNTDYSAKYYAQQSSISENNAKNHAETSQQMYNQFLDVVDTSTNNFLSTKKEALEDLENAKTESVQEITNLYNSSIDNINTQKTEALANIQAKSNEGVESIENEANNSLEELISLKSSTLNEVNNTKIEATSSITTLSNDYISQINTTGKSYNTLTNKQITNCILEVPQRIKYDLTDGVLTIKKGSQVIVPYGTVTPNYTIVGNPTIVDGVASGFSTSNYLTSSNSVTINPNNFRIHFEFTTGSDITTAQMIIRSTQGQNAFIIGLKSGKMRLFLNEGYSPNSWEIASDILSTKVLTANTKYNGYLGFNGSTYTLNLNNEDWITVKSSVLIRSSFVLKIGQGLSTEPFLGSIDLKQFSITVDGKLVYRPEAVHENFTRVGSPTIVDGVASGFLKDTENGYDATANTIRPIGFTLGQLKNKPYKIECSFTMPLEVTIPTNKILYSLGQTSRWEAWANSISLTSGGVLIFGSKFGTDESSTGNVRTTPTVGYRDIGMVLGGKYKYITEFDGVSLYSYKILNDNGRILKQWTYTPNTEDKNLYCVNTLPTETINIGSGNSAYTTRYNGWTGSIDLKQFSITVDGKVVYRPYIQKGDMFLNDNFKVADTQHEDGKFFVWVELVNDVSRNSFISTSTESIVSYNFSMDIVTVGAPTQWLSGTTKPTITAFFYNTTTNLIEFYDNGTLSQYTSFAFPLLIVSASSGIATSIKQVFNGIGYIGSTVWVDKGVKGLIPNGRKEDGTLNNIEYASDRIFMRTFNSTVADSNLEELIFCPFDSSFPYFTGSAIKGNYITNDGFLYNKNTDSILKGFSICLLSRRSGKVTEMIPKQPFRAIDYSDKSEVSGWSMPSSKPIELSWGAFGTEYTAPCNGFFEAGGRINNNGYIALWNKTINLGGKSCSSLDNFLLNAWIFANKGDVVQLQYVNYVSDGGVRFFPCVGCEREV